MLNNIVSDVVCKIAGDSSAYLSEDLIDDGYIDSMGIISIVDELEKRFEIKISAEDITADTFETVDTICTMLKKYVGETYAKEHS